MDNYCLFNIVKQVNKTDIRPEIYFLRATDETCFITSDNSVLCHEKWSYIPLSPQYAAFVLYDTRDNCRFQQNGVFQLSTTEVKKFNSLYWKQSDTYTIIGNNQKDLVAALEIEVRG